MARRNARFFDAVTERRLIDALRHGDERAFTTIYTTYRKPLVRHALNFTDVRHRAEDAVQDVCFKTWLDRETLHIRDSLTGYLFQAVRNRVYDLGRRDAVIEMEPFPDDEDEVAALAFAPEDAEEDARSSDCLRVIAMAVASLTPPVRRAFVLSLHDGITYQMIARQLHITVSTVRLHLISARNRCWDELVRTGLVDEHQRSRTGHRGGRRPTAHPSASVPRDDPRRYTPTPRPTAPSPSEQARESFTDREIPIPMYREPADTYCDVGGHSDTESRQIIDGLRDFLTTHR